MDVLNRKIRSSKFIKLCVSYIRYFLSQSTIHGLSHLAERRHHFIERILWVSLIGLGTYGAFILSGMTWTRYQQNPTVISMERDRFAWNTSFPGATVCPTFKLDEKLLRTYVEKSNAENKTALKEFLISLSEGTYETFDKVTHYDGISSDEYMKILYDLKFVFKPSVSNSGVNGRQYFLQEIVTEMGICYSFNSQLAIYNSPKNWFRNQWKILKQNEPFFVNPLDGEVFANVVNMSTGFKIYLHGPYEVPDISSKSIYSPYGYFMQIYLTGLTLYSSDRIRGLKVGQRKCRFYDESDLRYSPVYSFVLCRMECRAKLAKKLCNCIPHFYRKLKGDRVCDVSGLHCLAKYKKQLIFVKGKCGCYPNCEEVNYVVEHLDTRAWFLGSNLQWGLKEYPRMRLKRDIIFGFADVLVYIGGMAGLFFGCSVLSFIEILYYFTIRLFWFAVNARKS